MIEFQFLATKLGITGVTRSAVLKGRCNLSNQYVQTQVVCANCAAIRGEANHWYAVWLNRLPELTSIRVSKWDVESGAFPYMLPACGELCLLRLVAKNLEKL